MATTVGEVTTTPVTAVAEGTEVAELAAAPLDTGRRSVPIARRLPGRGHRDPPRHRADRGPRRRDRRQRRTHRLEIYGGEGRWQVDVHDGVATIGDRFDDECDRHVAKVLAEAVPGVARATAFAIYDEDDR